MDINKKFQVTLWGILGLIGTVVAVVVPATWIVAKVTESNELEAYRKGKDWKAAEAISSLIDLSKMAKLDAEERGELLRLRQQKQELAKAGRELQEQLDKLQTERDTLRRSLESIVKKIDTFEIRPGEARFVVPNTVAVGVVSIYVSLARCEVRVGERSETLQVGQALAMSFGGKGYSLILLRLSEKSCTFSFGDSSGG